MSRSKRRNDNTAPALFPFLAVLLCTIGALVLILAITVTNSHASARRDAETAMSDVKDHSDLIEVVSDELAAQREGLKQEVERRRRNLADIEDHIQRLNKSLELLVQRIDHIQAAQSSTEEAKTKRDELVASLRTEVDIKKKELLDEIAKQKNRKPAFSIIPYSGNNGTSRRPVYLECTKNGLIIQPEGLLIGLQDLRPPFGPGNPLDAALRNLRVAYQQRDVTFGITQPPYPLLLVRPDGINTYALAREAMSGWDDQFGYELIGDDMDLKFPQSIPGLKEQLSETIGVAKRRQQALIAAMPRAPISPIDGDSWDGIDAAAMASSDGVGAQADGNTANGQSSMQEWQLVQGMANSRVTGVIRKNGQDPPASSDNVSAINKPMHPSDNSQPFSSAPNTIPGGDFVLSSQSFTESGPYQGGSTATSNASNATIGTNGSNDINPSRSNAVTGMAGGGTNSGKNGNTNGGSNGSANGQGDSQGGSMSNGGSQVGSNQGGGGSNAMGSLTPDSNTSQNDSKANAFSSGSATGVSANDQITQEQRSELAKSKQSSSSDPSNASSNPSTNSSSSSSGLKAKHVNPDGDLKPISVSHGRGWAASRAENKATPVSRPIQVVALRDRWLIRSDVDAKSFESNITMEAGPQEAGNTLATALKKRVDSWGLAVQGGYWSPTLTIEAASDAQQSVARMQKLLEGSGVEIKVVPLTIPKR
jgi:uncharacterized protein YoxC